MKILKFSQVMFSSLSSESSTSHTPRLEDFPTLRSEERVNVNIIVSNKIQSSPKWCSLRKFEIIDIFADFYHEKLSYERVELQQQDKYIQNPKYPFKSKYMIEKHSGWKYLKHINLWLRTVNAVGDVRGETGNVISIFSKITKIHSPC